VGVKGRAAHHHGMGACHIPSTESRTSKGAVLPHSAGSICQQDCIRSKIFGLRRTAVDAGALVSALAEQSRDMKVRILTVVRIFFP
jgi:hypothetical protein